MGNLRLLGLTVLGAISAVASANVSSDFEAGADGWLGVNLTFPGLDVLNTVTPTWTGHSITATETGSGLFVWGAPTKFLGDKNSYYGGSVSFLLSDAVSDGLPYPNLLLRGNGTVLYYQTPAPGTTLTGYSINLTAAGWKNGLGNDATQADFMNALGNLDAFGINADWKTNSTDATEIDNVSMVQPVPEPATLAILGLGLASRLRRRKN